MKILSMRLMTGRGALGRVSERLFARKYRFGMQTAKLPSGSASIPGTDVNIGVDLGEVTFTGERSMLQSAATARLETLAKKKRGLLITLDEVQASDMDELRALATSVQHLIREQRDVAFIFAGLSSTVE